MTTIVCECNVPAKMLKVLKESENKGRHFYVCAKAKEGCKFFQWAERSEANNITSKDLFKDDQPKHNATCKCGSEPVLLKVNKDGPNKGRYFFSCALKSKDNNGCNHFEWCDDQTIISNELSKSKNSGASKKDTSDTQVEVISLDSVSITTSDKSIISELLKIGAKRREESFIAQLEKIKQIPKIMTLIPGYTLSMIKPLPEVKVDWKKIPKVLLDSLLPFQKLGVEHAVQRNGRILIGDEMGLGKTIQAIAIATYYFEDWPMLIICPSQLRQNWKCEIRKWMTYVKEDDVTIIENGKFNDLTLINVISYDLVSKDDVLSKIKPHHFQFVIVDESHFIKSSGAKRTQAVCPLIEKSKRCVLLSGTATPSRPIELYTQIKPLSQLKNFSETSYGDRYCESTYNPSTSSNYQQRFLSQKYQGAQRLLELNLILSRYMIRRLKSEVMSELPKKKRNVTMLECSSKDMKEYQEKFGSDPRKMDKSKLMEMYSATANVKISRVQQYIKSHLYHIKQKCLLFAHHRSMLDAIEQVIKQSEWDYIRIDGTTPAENRHDLCNTFKSDDNVQFAILGLTVAGTGLNFVPCSCVVFTELSWTPGLLLQSEDRCHRIGTNASFIDVRYLIAKNTCDEYMFKLIQKKLKVIGETLDGEGKRAGNGLFDNKQSSHDRFVPGQQTLEHFMFKKQQKTPPAEKNTLKKKTSNVPLKSESVIVVDDEDDDDDVIVNSCVISDDDDDLYQSSKKRPIIDEDDDGFDWDDHPLKKKKVMEDDD
ncbi:hypothetical protein AKO1_009042 [Acrasis kona]|uniref:Uncharacterized protein n=1 Tax=Acrasis kona TaxID=1008807 RepID=A0AAW2ZKC7_9EUKA